MKAWMIAGLALLLVHSAPLAAQTPPPQQMPAVELDETVVRSFLASLPDLRELADTYDTRSRSGGNSPLSAFEGLATSAAVRAEVDSTVGRHGFDDYRTWTIVARNVFSTFAFVKMGDMQAQMSAALAAIEQNPQLTPEQKATMRRQIGGAVALNGPQPSENNIAVITGMLPEIEASIRSMN